MDERTRQMMAMMLMDQDERNRLACLHLAKTINKALQAIATINAHIAKERPMSEPLSSEYNQAIKSAGDSLNQAVDLLDIK